jgi:hypothetical protein
MQTAKSGSHTVWDCKYHTDEVWKKYIEDQKPEEPDDNFKVV